MRRHSRVSSVHASNNQREPESRQQSSTRKPPAGRGCRTKQEKESRECRASACPIGLCHRRTRRIGGAFAKAIRHVQALPDQSPPWRLNIVQVNHLEESRCSGLFGKRKSDPKTETYRDLLNNETLPQLLARCT